MNKRPTRMPCSLSQRWRNSRQLGGRESGSKRATKLLIGTSETTLKILAATKRGAEPSASQRGVLHVGCARKATARLDSRVSAYQNGITAPRLLAKVRAALTCTASSRRLIRG